MAKLEWKGNVWNWETSHRWIDRDQERHPRKALIHPSTRVFTMGSCFAQNVAHFLRTRKVNATSFPETTHYNTFSSLQDLKHILEGPVYTEKDMWQTPDGRWANPFRKPSYRAQSLPELMAWTHRVDQEAKKNLLAADIVVITLGGTELWRHPQTKKVYLTIPFPDLFNSKMPGLAEPHNMTFQENYAAMEECYFLIQKHVPHAHLIFTVSPNRMSFTITDKDVVNATSYGKSTLRSSVGELVDHYNPDGKGRLHYFHSYEIVCYSPFPTDLYEKDQRHVSNLAVAHVMNEFIYLFGSPELQNDAEREYSTQILADRAIDLHVKSMPLKLRVKRTMVRTLKIVKMDRAALALYGSLRKG